MAEKQQTLGSAVSAKGRGLHTGATVSVTLNPADAGTGIRFRRTDLEGTPVIDALAENVTQTSRSTMIEKRGASVCTIEHLMAALWGMGVDNALIDIDGAEVPIMNGSASAWVELIAKAGVVAQDAEREYYAISEKIEFSLPENGVRIEAYPDDHFSAVVNVDFGSKVIGRQFAAFSDTEDFAKEVAPSRTFVFLHDVELLLKNNMIKGGDLDNAIVVVENPIPKEKAEELGKQIGRSVDGADKPGYVSSTPLHFDNEIARHKLLDLLGDLALVGVRLRGKIVASRPGHYSNTELAKAIRKHIKRDSDRPSFRYDPNATPVYDINRIKATLPHRPPFLLVDKIMHITDTEVVGIKNVTMNEPFFVGHFPDEPVMPGVLIVEAMAQCGGILALSTVDEPERYSTYFMKIDNVRFKRMVVPGDTLMFVLELTEPIRRGIVMMEARAYVGDALATEASLMAMITKNR